jgi:NAD-dependent deacetylase
VTDPAFSGAIEPLRDRITRARGVVILTGAGVSAESGVPTFRGADGLWGRYRAEELATPEAFARDPRLVWEWYDLRRRALAAVEPNPGHRALAGFLLAREDATLVTQNVDGLHARALAEAGGPVPHPRIHELHGSIARLKCARPACAWSEEDLREVDGSNVETLPRCPEPGCGGLLRPAVVWFGEMLPERALAASFEAAASAEVCIVAGTSALVHPAASVPLATLRAGGVLIEVNPEPTPLSSHAEACIRGAAGVVLPALLGQGAERGVGEAGMSG